MFRPNQIKNTSVTNIHKYWCWVGIIALYMYIEIMTIYGCLTGLIRIDKSGGRLYAELIKLILSLFRCRQHYARPQFFYVDFFVRQRNQVLCIFVLNARPHHQVLLVLLVLVFFLRGHAPVTRFFSYGIPHGCLHLLLS